MITKIEIQDNDILVNGKLVSNYKSKYIVEQDQFSIIMKEGNLIVKRKFDTTLPLYYTISTNNVYISTNINNLPRKYTAKINTNKLNEFLTYGYIFPPYTLWENIYKMPVLSYGQISNKSGRVKFDLKYDFLITKGKTRLIDNISKQLKLEKGFLMFSGGLDSIILSKMFSEQVDGNYTSGFEFDKQDLIEKEYAFSAAEYLDIHIKYQSYDFNELLKLLPKAIWYTQQPLNHIQTLLIYKMLKEMPQTSKYVYNGQGADAIFGTNAQAEYFNSQSYRLKSKKMIKKFCQLNLPFVQNGDYVFDNNETVKSELDLDFYVGLLGDCEITIQSWALLAKSCKKNMIFPFFSEANYALVINSQWNERVSEPKKMLRDLARKMGVSEQFINRKKASFGPVSTNWGKYLEVLLPMCDEIIKKYNIDIMIMKNEDCRYNLWNLINLAVWEMIFIDRVNLTKIENKIKELLKDENKFKD